MKAFVEEHKSAIVEGRARPVQDYGPYRHEVGQNDYANPRNSSRRIGIYCLTEKSGRQRIGGFNVDDTGVANLEVMNEQFRAKLLELTEGAASHLLNRRVTPAEGLLFLDAVSEHFDQSSDWGIVDETDKTPEVH